MKKINFRGVSETLSEREMKRVVGGLSACQSDADCVLGVSCIDGVCGGSSGICFRCSNGIQGYCSSGDCVTEIGNQCPGGWIQWNCG